MYSDKHLWLAFPYHILLWSKNLNKLRKVRLFSFSHSLKTLMPSHGHAERGHYALIVPLENVYYSRHVIALVQWESAKILCWAIIKQ